MASTFMSISLTAGQIVKSTSTITTSILYRLQSATFYAVSSRTTSGAVSKISNNPRGATLQAQSRYNRLRALNSLAWLVSSIVYIFAFLIVFAIVIVLRMFTEPCLYALQRGVKRIGKAKTRIIESDTFPIGWVFWLFNFVILNVLKLFELLVLRWLAIVLRYIVGLVVLATLFVILEAIRTRVAMLAETYAQTVVLGAEAYNAGTDVSTQLLDIQNTMLPYTNTITATSMLIVAHIEKGINSVSGAGSDAPPDPIAVSGRRLDDAQSNALSLVETMAFIEVTMNYLTLLIIDVFFTIIFPVLKFVVAVLVWLITFLACSFSSALCALREIGVSILAEAVVPFGYAIFGGFINFVGGPSMEDAQDNLYADLACSAQDLYGVNCVCAGHIFDGDPGIFSNLDACDDPTAKNQTTTVGSRRALTVFCRLADDGSFVEEVGDMTTHRSSTEACPSAKRAFGAYTHAVDMQRWDVHTCITHCVNGTAFSACDYLGNHTVEVLGSCDGSARMTMHQARRNLAFLGVDTSKMVRAKPKLTHRQRRRMTSGTTKSERVSFLRKSTPTQFWIDGMGQCDLSSPATSLFEWIDDVMCVMMYHSQKAQHVFDRGRSLDAKAAFDMAHWVRTSRHMASAPLHEIENPHPLLVMWHHLKRPKPVTRRRTQDITAPDEDAALKCMNRYWCPQTNKCVVDMKLCTQRPEEWTPLLFLSYQMGEISSTIETFDAKRMIRDTINCYDTRPANLDPNSPTNLFRDMDAMTSDERLIYCPGEFKPSAWRPERITYDARKEIQTLCTGTPAFNGCKCPDYFGDSIVEYQWKGVFSINLLRRLASGAKWVALTFVIISNAFVGVFYQLYVSVTGTLRMPKWTRLSANGLTYEETLKCWALHSSDGLLFIIFCILGFALIVCLVEYWDWFVKSWIPNENARDWLLLRTKKQIDQAAMKNPTERLMRRFKKSYDFYDFSNGKLEFDVPIYDDDEAEAIDEFRDRVKDEYGYTVGDPVPIAKRMDDEFPYKRGKQPNFLVKIT